MTCLYAVSVPVSIGFTGRATVQEESASRKSQPRNQDHLRGGAVKVTLARKTQDNGISDWCSGNRKRMHNLRIRSAVGF